MKEIQNTINSKIGGKRGVDRPEEDWGTCIRRTIQRTVVEEVKGGQGLESAVAP